MPRAAPAAKQALVTAAGRGKDTKPVAAQPRAFMPETRIEKCPLCVEEMDDTDLQFEPCPCGYKVCLFCFDKLKLLCSSMCPHCRRIYGTVDDISEASKEDTSDDAAACAVDASQTRVAPARQAAAAASGLPNGGAAGASAAPKPAAQQPAKMAATAAAQGRKAEAGAAAKPVPGAGGAEASHHHGLPGTATWATAAAAMRTESVEMERPSLATAIGDETAWPSLADATTNARAKPEPDTRRRDQAGAAAGPWQLANHHHDRAASSSSSMDQLVQDPPLTQDQVLQFQQQQAQAAVAQQQQQQRQQQQAQQQQLQAQAQAAQQQAQAAQQQQQQQQPSTSYQPLGPQFPPPGFAALRREGAAPLAPVNGGADQFLPPSSLHSAPPQQLVQMLLQKERENGKVQPLVAAAKPPPGFAPSTAGVVAPVAAPAPTYRPPDLSMLNNDENPVVPGPPVTRCRPISPPAANGNCGNGPIGKVANTGSLHTPGVYSMWSGLPVVDLSVYNPLSHLWQNANTPVQGLVQHQHHQQQQQQHPQQHLPLHLQQQHAQQQQYSNIGASSLDPAIVFPPAPQPTKLPPPGFGGPSAYGHVAAGQGENGIPRNGTYRPPYQPIGTRTTYNPLEFVQQQAAMYRPHLGTGL